MKIFLCDDKQQEREYYSKNLQRLAKREEIPLELRCFTNGTELLFHLEDNFEDLDAVYLDINMPGMDGVQVAETLREMGFEGEIIFLTVSQKHFLPAFDVRAFNYIVKDDRSQDRFEAVFQKIADFIREKEKECILLTAGSKHAKVELDTIHYFEIRKRIITVYYKNTEFSFFSSMERLESKLSEKGFLRVNRAYLVAEHAILETAYESILLRNGVEIPIGRTYQAHLREYFKEKMQ